MGKAGGGGGATDSTLYGKKLKAQGVRLKYEVLGGLACARLGKGKAIKVQVGPDQKGKLPPVFMMSAKRHRLPSNRRQLAPNRRETPFS